MKRFLPAAFLALIAGIFMLGAAQPLSAQPLSAQPQSAKPTTSGLEGLAFLRGTWIGTLDGSPVEETWSAPRGDSIMGMFRWQSPKGETTMWELLAIKVEEGKPTLRLRHFDAKFEPWKAEAEGIVPMPASGVSDTRVLFANTSEKGGLKSVEYSSPKPGQLLVTVSFKDAKREALKFDLARDGK